jgi:hypothetical protein
MAAERAWQSERLRDALSLGHHLPLRRPAVMVW